MKENDESERSAAEEQLRASLLTRLRNRREFILGKIEDASRSSRGSDDLIEFESDLIFVETELEKLRTIKND